MKLRADVARKATRQTYGPRPQIRGVRLVDLRRHVDDGGSFVELVRLKRGVALGLPRFDVAQVNFSEVEPGAVKAWHVHHRQDDIWFVDASSHLLVGLWDVRAGTATSGLSQRIVLGSGRSQLLFIPRGVAHGSTNLGSTTAHVVYLVNQVFDAKDPDEHRLPWDALGEDFWKARPG